MKIKIPIDSVDCNLYYDLLKTNLGKVFNEGTDREYLEFEVCNSNTNLLPNNKSSSQNIIIHDGQKTIYDM